MDKISSEHRSANMRAIRGKDTAPELIVRRTAYHMGYRYRLRVKTLPGKPDLVFSSRRKVIFVHGCFWHQHPAAKCADARPPRSNLAYWQPKLARNVERDAEHVITLKANGWRSLVIWDCETKHMRQLTARLRQFLRS
jgi:DNA mismatch endonuclease (patch repair protein)